MSTLCKASKKAIFITLFLVGVCSSFIAFLLYKRKNQLKKQATTSFVDLNPNKLSSPTEVSC